VAGVLRERPLPPHAVSRRRAPSAVSVAAVVNRARRRKVEVGIAFNLTPSEMSVFQREKQPPITLL
jgi:hypothetical protein